jgi:fatty-acyl-CoA synthase
VTETLGTALAEIARRFPNREAIVFEGRRLTWQEIDQQTDSLALALLDKGVQRGDRVGILSNNRPEYVVVYLAVARIGAILVGFNINYTLREIREYAIQVRPKVMIVQGDMDVAAQLEPTVDSLPSVAHFLSIGPQVPESAQDLHECLGWQPGQPHPQLAALAQRQATVGPHDGALIVFTGGTTGRPKPALLTHRNIISNIRAQNRHVDFRSEDRIMSHMPMNHVSGLLLITTGALLAGATLIQTQRFHPVETLALAVQEQITILGQVPTMWIMQFLLPDFDEYDLSSLRITIVAGSPTPDMAMRKIATLAPRTVHGYGLTEVGGMVTYTRHGEGLAYLLAGAGQAADEFEVMVADDADQPVAAGQEGEILVRGACVMPGYFDDEGATAAQITADGWLRTGDLGRMDAGGYLTITGRSKEMFISGGYNVYAWEVENYVHGHPDVALCACIGVADSVMGEVGALFVQPVPGASVRGRDMRNFCKTGLARYKTPRYVHIMDKLPLTSVGKVDKISLAQATATQPAPSSPR